MRTPSAPAATKIRALASPPDQIFVTPAIGKPGRKGGIMQGISHRSMTARSPATRRWSVNPSCFSVAGHRRRQTLDHDGT